MTSLVAWVSEDTHGHSALYIATDSRLSWAGPEPLRTWDFGKKLFSSRTVPLVLGFTGDAIFIPLALGQLIDLIDEGLLFEVGSSVEERTGQIGAHIEALRPFPNALPSTVVCGWRTGVGASSAMRLFELTVPVDGATTLAEHRIREDRPLIRGSGAGAVRVWTDLWAKGLGKMMSRAVFSGFCDAVSSGEDPRSGGSVQLTGLFREGGVRVFGTFGASAARLSVSGTPLSSTPRSPTEVFNELFERVDATGQRLPDAQRHSVPNVITERRAQGRG